MEFINGNSLGEDLDAIKTEIRKVQENDPQGFYQMDALVRSQASKGGDWGQVKEIMDFSNKNKEKHLQVTC